MSRHNTVGKVATSIRQEGKVTRVTYHATIVVEWDDTKITLRNGGWRTPTTKVRMNQASNQFGLGFGVYQDNNTWFVRFRNRTFEFYDGIVLFWFGKKLASCKPLPIKTAKPEKEVIGEYENAVLQEGGNA